MKRIAAIAILALAGSLAAGNALAQHRQIRANVPFSFFVGDKILPAGAYSITSISTNIIEIRSRDRKTDVLVAAFRATESSEQENVLVFEKHAGLYSLRDILCDSAPLNVSLPAENWKRVSPMEEAKNAGPGRLVLLAINN